MKSLARYVLVAALMVSIGLHWNVLQVVAWANMLRDYTASEGVIQGVVMTFDGEHPCPMCVGITKGKSKQQGESDSPVASDKVSKAPEWLSESSPVKKLCDTWRALADTRSNLEPQLMAAQWNAKPPTPPPRVAGKWST